MSIVITSVACGSLRSRQGAYPATVSNGVFRISGNAEGLPVGDGINETTTWTFECWKLDLDGDPDLLSSLATLEVTSAWLTLTLVPGRGADFPADTVRVKGLTPIHMEKVGELPTGVASTVRLQLRDDYSSQQILGAFAKGQIPMVYEDDATICFAELDLTLERA